MPGSSRPHVSLILTVKDEAASVEALLESIADQVLAPDEIILVDGGSSDGTLEIVKAWTHRLNLTLLAAPGANISTGRNLALAHASGEIVAVTDGGVRLDPCWLERLTAPFTKESAEQPDVVGGFFRADPRTLFEWTLGATTLPDAAEIDASRFLPSSRSVAFRRSWYRAGIQYPEWLDYCEDLILDLRLRRAGARFRFQPSAFVWFRPRSTPKAFWRQYYHYARGDGKAGLFARRHALRYLAYGVVAPWVLLRRDPRLVALTAVGGALYLRCPWIRLWRRRQELGAKRLALALGLTPALRILGDAAKMAGYPVGLAWRIRLSGLRRTWRDIPEARASLALSEAVAEPVPQELSGP